MRVKDLMKRDIITVTERAALREVVRLLSTSGVSGIPVVDGDGKLVGIITEHDVVKALMPTYEEIISEESATLDVNFITTRAYQVRDNPVSSIVTRNVVTVTQDDPVIRAASIMVIKKLKLLPVLKDGRPIGTVSRIDIARALVEGLESRETPGQKA